MMLAMIRGIDVILHQRVQTGTDEADRPIYLEELVTVENVLVGQPSSDDLVSDHDLSSKKIVYTLGIPKGDDHDWEDTVVEFFGRKWHTVGLPMYGIEANMPLDWKGNIGVERYE